ncbi:polyadenylate-binding protein-interacting protein 6 [Impatiens glandulifera]|uniref:polyadenylate-binding protein-interacting protein 6 n=1 Tax=Impatiens glandulifera TaxID=253017 RepID=UPI001FB05803|nr:polyadenylate-binding protein-interacting protein 6 [Impatiens glandulifera]
MKSGTSSLNPYAAAYIPLSRRNTAWQDTDPKSKNETGKVGLHTKGVAWNQHQASDEYMMKGKITYGSYGSTSQSSKDRFDKANLTEEFDMDLTYLQMTFPGISDESLAEVYLANKRDLEAAVEMLRQLELDTDDFSDLPDSLDIGDIVESGFSLKNGKDEIAGSSIGSS